MRVGILTHYNVASHGAYLQLYAMCRVLQQMGHTPIVMTYKKNFDFMSDEESKKFQVRLRSVPYYLKEYLLKSGVSNVVFQVRKHNELKNLAVFILLTLHMLWKLLMLSLLDRMRL